MRNLLQSLLDKGGPKFKPILKTRPSATPAPQDSAGEGTSETLGIKTRTRNNGRNIAVDQNTIEGTEGSSRSKRTRTKQKPTRDTDIGETPDASDSDSGDSDTDNSDTGYSESPAKKRNRKRRRTVIAEPQALEGTPEPIDPTKVTMSAICNDLGSGRVSSRWETSQLHYTEARKRAKEERARAVMEANEEERETGRIGSRKGGPKPVLPGEGDETSVAGEESVVENTGRNPDEFTYTESLKTSHYAPQVRIGLNGEVVLDTDSLQVDRAADPEIAEEAYSFVEESDQSKFTNSSSWSKRRTVRWGKEDTAMFYDVCWSGRLRRGADSNILQALRQFGQNFDLIARVLPGRTYQMCKNKFKSEDKKNSGLIDDALKNGIAVGAFDPLSPRLHILTCIPPLRQIFKRCRA